MGSAFRSALSMVLIGAALGYILSALGSNLLYEGRAFGASGEAPEARAFITALIRGDSTAPQQSSNTIVSRAIQSKVGQVRSQRVVPLSLTYLGGASQGKLSVHIYAIQSRNSAGQEAFESYALTLLDGKVVRRE